MWMQHDTGRRMGMNGGLVLLQRRCDDAILARCRVIFFKWEFRIGLIQDQSGRRRPDNIEAVRVNLGFRRTPAEVEWGGGFLVNIQNSEVIIYSFRFQFKSIKLPKLMYVMNVSTILSPSVIYLTLRDGGQVQFIHIIIK